MTPKEAVEQLGQFLRTHESFGEDDAYDALMAAGLDAFAADEAFKFTQTACGRDFLDGMGIQFSAKYFWVNGNGDVVKTGLFADEPHFVAAMEMARRNVGAPGFLHLSLMSADVQAINNALNGGSKPENLQMLPALFFTEQPTPEGMARATELQTTVVSKPEAVTIAADDVAKPWWKVW